MNHNFEGIRLSTMQEELLNYVVESIKEGRDYYYCETGDCKPWDNRTVSGLQQRGIVKFVEGGDSYIQPGGVYFLTLGANISKQIRENKFKILFDETS